MYASKVGHYATAFQTVANKSFWSGCCSINWTMCFCTSICLSVFITRYQPIIIKSWPTVNQDGNPWAFIMRLGGWTASFDGMSAWGTIKPQRHPFDGTMCLTKKLLIFIESNKNLVHMRNYHDTISWWCLLTSRQDDSSLNTEVGYINIAWCFHELSVSLLTNHGTALE